MTHCPPVCHADSEIQQFWRYFRGIEAHFYHRGMQARSSAIAACAVAIRLRHIRAAASSLIAAAPGCADGDRSCLPRGDIGPDPATASEGMTLAL